MSCGGIGTIQLTVERLGVENSRRRCSSCATATCRIMRVIMCSIWPTTLCWEGYRARRDRVGPQGGGFLNALGTLQRILDPRTSGEFTGRFDESANEESMEGINRVGQRVWKMRAKDSWKRSSSMWTGGQRKGKCKGGMGISHKGIWGLYILEREFGQYQGST